MALNVCHPNLPELLSRQGESASVESMARRVDAALREHFNREPHAVYYCSVGALSYTAHLEGLTQTIEDIAAVDVTVARQISALLRQTDPEFYAFGVFYRNVTETKASLGSFWPHLQKPHICAVKLDCEEANSFIARSLELIPNHCPNAFDVLHPGRRFWRGRIEETGSNLRDCIVSDPYAALTAPPFDRAKENRANAAGVRCFYGASNLQTCLSELRLETGWLVYLGGFVVKAPLPVLDLRKLADAPFPSIFSHDYSSVAREIGWLRAIPQEFAHAAFHGDKATHKGSRYFSEFCRQRHRASIHGLVFGSAQNPMGFNVALYADTWDGRSDPLHLLEVRTTQMVSRTTIARGVDVLIPSVFPIDVE